MKFKLIFFLLFVSLLEVSCGLWEISKQEGFEKALEQLTPAQTQCVKQITDISQIMYVQLQSDNRFIGIGYTTESGIYVGMLSLNQDRNCKIEFKDKIEELKDSFGNKYRPVFKKIQQLEFTGDNLLDVYVWLDLYGVGQMSNARHHFYSKQTNGSYNLVYYALLCRDWSSVEFVDTDNQDKPYIVISDDRRCGNSRGKHDISNTELFLTNEGFEVVRTWLSE